MIDQELIKQWDEYIESMGSVMGAVEHMAQQMRDRIELLVKERDETHDEAMAAIEMWGAALKGQREAEAKLAKAVETLQKIADGSSDNSEKEAKRVLAELEGEPLGAEFEEVWDENKGELYES